jgi:transcriptional regulator with XRE-family HTH domain
MGDRRTTPVDAVLGQNIRMYRIRRGLTQMEFGRRVGVGFQQIQKYETGENRVSAGRLTQIALVLGVPLPMLLENSPVGTASDDQSARALLPKRHSARLVLAFDRVRHEPMRMAILELIEAIGKRAGGAVERKPLPKGRTSRSPSRNTGSRTRTGSAD